MLKFGPNPFTDVMNLDIKTEVQTSLQVMVYNMQGVLIQTLENAQVSKGVHHFTWNGKNSSGNELPAGIYNLDIRTGGGTHNSYRLVKIRE